MHLSGYITLFAGLLALVSSTGTSATGGRPASSFGGREGRGGHTHSHGAMKNMGLKGFGTEDEEDPENQLKNENFIRNAE